MNTVINVDNIKKSLGNRLVIKGISFNVFKGDIFGYLGPNGAGKTTTIRLFLGLLKADSGKISIMDNDINHGQTKKKIGFVLDSDGLYDNMTAKENIIFYARIYGLEDTSDKIEKILKIVKLSDRADDRISTYSKGMRQRLALARSMIHDPEVLILDEPTSGVDPSGQIEIRQLLLDISSKEKKTIFLSSHNLDEVQRICNRIALIDRGKIKLYGNLSELCSSMGERKLLVKTANDITSNLTDGEKNKTELDFQEINKRSIVFSFNDENDIPKIVDLLVSRGVKIEEVIKKETSLEELYSSILKKAQL